MGALVPILKSVEILVVAALIFWGFSFSSDSVVFDVFDRVPKGIYDAAGIVKDRLGPVAMGDYLACKLLLLVFLIAAAIALGSVVGSFIYALGQKKLCPDGVADEYRIAGYCLIYLIPIIAVLVFKLPEGFLSNDERLIYQEAAALNHYTWFYYLTTWYYIVTMSLIPCWLGPVLVKVALQVVTCGYCVFRFKRALGSRWAYLTYVPFFLFPVLAYTTSAHRIPVYYLIYLLFLVKLYADRLEGKESGKNGLIWLLFASALITQWRTEGIYMAPLAPILLALAYPGLVGGDKVRFDIKKAAALLAAVVLVQYLVQIPQNGLLPNRMDDKAANRMGPFWAYTITNMYRNGLDLEKNKEDLEKVYKYLDRDVLRSINEDLGDINYEDTLILYYQGYTGVIPGGDYAAYVEGCENIFRNNPDVFLRTRIGAFKYAALPYSAGTDEGGLKGVIKYLFSLFKALSYNLFIPCILVLIFWAAALFRKQWLLFFMLSGVICHWFIVFILAPASYFKYYLPVYLTGYFTLFAGAATWLVRKNKEAHIEHREGS